jgi:hypothetical protein
MKPGDVIFTLDNWQSRNREAGFVSGEAFMAKTLLLPALIITE